MTAKASIEFHSTARVGGQGAINGLCIAQEELAVSSTAATGVLVITATHQAAGVTHARISADDTPFYVAIGSVPDATATAATDKTSARVMVPAGATIELPIALSEKTQVKQVA